MTWPPADVGLTVAPADEVPGGDPAQNADTARRIFAGETGPTRPARDLAVLNAGAAIYAGGRAATLRGGGRGSAARPSTRARRRPPWSAS